MLSVFTTRQYNGEEPKSWHGLGGREYCVVVPILNPNLAEGLVRLAIALAGVQTPGGEEEKRRVRVVVLGIVTVPEDTPLSQGASLVKAYRTLLRYIPPESSRLSERVEVRTEVRVAREVWQGIADQVQEEAADLLLLHWKGDTRTLGKIYGTTIDALMEEPPCDIVLARLNAMPQVKNILLPVRGGSYSSLAMRLVSNMAEHWNAGVTVMHNLSQTADTIPAATENVYYPATLNDDDLNAFQNVLNEFPAGARLLTTQGQLERVIAREATYHDLVVLGASGPEESRQDSQAFLIARRVAHDTGCALLVVKTRKPLRLAPTRSPAQDSESELRETVDRWFAQNTFHYREFRSLSSLTLLKERNNLSISLVFPVYGPTHPLALAEAVRRARFALMRDCALLDEIVVSAPGVKLDNQEIALLKAELAGEENDEVIFLGLDGSEEEGPAEGPAESLWQALQATRGDIIIWADPHISGFEARLFYGLAGPLLTYPEFQLAVGFYSESTSEETEHSRPLPNELVEMGLRPLLGGLFPPLAGVIDPSLLIGAARRDHLERLPFFTSAAFTTGILIDTAARAGLMSIAQVDLGHPPVHDLPPHPQRILSEVLEVILRRTGERSQTALMKLYSPGIKTVHKTNGVYSLQVEAASTAQREIPPLAYTSGYQRHSF